MYENQEAPERPAPELDDLSRTVQGVVLENDEIEAMGEAERLRIEQAYEIYKATHRESEPKLRQVKFFADSGPEVIGLLTSALGSIIISALRVGTILFVSELNLASLYAQVENEASWLAGILDVAPVLVMLAGMFGFEGYLFALGYRKGKESNQTHISNWGVMVAFLVTISAGLLSSLTLTATSPFMSAVTSIVQFLVVVSTGIGAPVIAYFGAENIGVVVNGYRMKVAEANGEYQDALQKFDAGFWTFYKRRARQLFGVDRSEEGATSAPKKAKKEESAPGVQDEVQQWLLNSNLSPYDIGTGINHKASPAVIAQALGLEDSGPVRTALNRLRKNWK